MPRYLPLMVILFLAACGSEPGTAGPFSAAAPVSPQEPIPYPPALFASGIEGEVMLYLVVDSTGAVLHDSTRVEKSSGHSEFDAAAMQAAPTLRFTPAHRGDTAVMAAIQVPIHFTLPDSTSQPETP